MCDSPSARRPVWRRPGAWIGAALLLAAAAAPGGLAQAHLVSVAPRVGLAHPLAGSSLTFSPVNLTDAPSYQPRYLNATVSGPVHVSVHLFNVGAIAHTFTVVNVSQANEPLNRFWTPENLTAYFVAYPPTANVSVAAGQSAWANFSLAENSSFRSLEFVSTEPYQFQAGMWGYLNLTPLGPTFVVSENTTNAFQFVPNVLSAGPTAHGIVTLDVHVLNLGTLGSLQHTFTVVAQSNQTLTTIGYFASHPPLVNVTVYPSTATWANFTVPGSGVYEYACTVLGHFNAGMFGYLYVGVPVPPVPPSPSTALVGLPVLAGSAVLLGIGLALAVGAAFTGRFPRKRTPSGPSP